MCVLKGTGVPVLSCRLFATMMHIQQKVIEGFAVCNKEGVLDTILLLPKSNVY